jgi:cyanophycinase
MAQKITSAKSKNNRMPVPQGKLLCIGGKEDKGAADPKRQTPEYHNMEILSRFAEELAGNNPTVAIIPTASNEPDELVRDYKEVFRKLKIPHVEVLDVRTREDAKNQDYCKIIEKAAGIFITGGDQLKLTAILGSTRLLQLMKERYTFSNVIVAGTSAGAAALSTPMIYEGEMQGGMIKGDVRVTTGLEFLKDVAVDTHFITRGRMVRMAQAIATNPGCIGIGLEEDTAILVTEGCQVQVLGSGLVTVMDGMDISSTNIYEIGNGEPFSIRDLKVHLLRQGDLYTLPVYNQLHI